MTPWAGDWSLTRCTPLKSREDGMSMDVEASGAHVGRECSLCRELRLRDDDRLRYSARDVAMAYVEGYGDALKRCEERDDDQG